MNDLTIFNFEAQRVRLVTLSNESWFVAADVATVLEYADPSMMLKLVDEEDKQTINPQKLDSVKMTESFSDNTFKVSLVNESGLYACIFGSTKPQAKKFKKWVTAEVLPSIRKTGTYSVSPAPQTRMEMLAEIAQQMVEQERQLKQHFQVLDELVANKEQAEEELKALPLSADTPAEIPTRGRINMIVRNCVRRSNAAYSAIWDKLYLELYYRYKFDVKARCRRSGRKPLDQIEVDGMLEALYAIASEVLA
ncbi:BRO family protein [Microcoleus sp. B3-D7]|uniref:BRO family protein n=1 Tax=Microcoleus sp. B3-D7 TaxID=2818659 RepID=UPI002FD6B341